MDNDSELAERYVRQLAQSPAYQIGKQAAERAIAKRMLDVDSAEDWAALKSVLDALRHLDTALNAILIEAHAKRNVSQAIKRMSN